MRKMITEISRLHEELKATVGEDGSCGSCSPLNASVTEPDLFCCGQQRLANVGVIKLYLLIRERDLQKPSQGHLY